MLCPGLGYNDRLFCYSRTRALRSRHLHPISQVIACSPYSKADGSMRRLVGKSEAIGYILALTSSARFVSSATQAQQHDIPSHHIQRSIAPTPQTNTRDTLWINGMSMKCRKMPALERCTAGLVSRESRIASYSNFGSTTEASFLQYFPTSAQSSTWGCGKQPGELHPNTPRFVHAEQLVPLKGNNPVPRKGTNVFRMCSVQDPSIRRANRAYTLPERATVLDAEGYLRSR